ncbi:phage replisome organizer N-terminal domain-containing protein [Leuconostoc mesenteroides]|uniref:phage replisome organizer N-terminal domain-containing protein n=1 Tax=Leuconostoc mesenteroides TaxID=1245 RepID=UPI000DFF6651|nr:phage replisome organizer N-terminal domain-containing protein [Leuconostoc mesenteroides]STY39700.1 phage replisome organizer, putative, N-terminal region [Leuconostoc mesenteroides]
MADRKKRYFWLQLKEDFFDDDTMSFIEEQPNGIEYSLIYLKMCLKSLKLDGFLHRVVGNTVIPYDIPTLAKLVHSNVDTVRVAMKMFEEIGLVNVLDGGEIYMSQIEEMIGSETEAAKQKRLERARKEIATLSHDGRKKVAQSKSKSLEIDTEKELDVVDDEQKINDDDKSKAYSALVNILEQNGFGTIGGLVSTDINKELDDFAEANNGNYREAYSVILQAIKISVGNGVCKFKYLWNVTRDWYQRKLFTLKDIEASEKKRDDEKSKSKQHSYNGRPQRVEPQMITKPVAESSVGVSDVAKELAELKEMGIQTKLKE